MYIRVTQPSVALYALQACHQRARQERWSTPPVISIAIAGDRAFFQSANSEVQRWCREFLERNGYDFETQGELPALSYVKPPAPLEA